MGKFRVKIEHAAQEDLVKIYKAGDKSTVKKLQKIMVELSDHPAIGIGNPEILKHSLSGLWSRRLNKKDRIIYEIFEKPEELVVVISALGHY